MDAADYSRLAEIVTQAMDLPESERELAIEEACGGDAELLAEALKILAFTQLPEENSGPESSAIAGTDRATLRAFTEGEITKRRRQLDRALDVPAVPTDQWMPERIASYEVVRLVGRGGSGIVFEARQDRPSRSVAIKLLHPALVTKDTAARFFREAEVLGRLHHPGIAQIFEAGTFDAGLGAQSFLAMELIDGDDLMGFVHGNKLGRRARLELFERVVDATAHAHERGIVHRDLKPDNVLVQASDGRPKLVDFGIAAVAEDDALRGATLEGQLLGTVAYMAPEQASRTLGAVGPSTDVYALSAMAFELITDRRLRKVEGLTVTQALEEVSRRDAPQIRRVVSGVDRDLATIIQKGLELRPSDRYPNAMELGADLNRYLEHRPIAARPSSRLDLLAKYTRRNRLMVGWAVATAAALLIGLIATANQARRATRTTRAAERQLYAAEMLLATSAVLDPAQGSRVSNVVDRWRPDASGENRSVTPGWEWALLDSVARDDTIRIASETSPLGIAWHPGGETLAVVGTSAVFLFDSHSGKPLEQLDVQSWAGDDSIHLNYVTWDPVDANRVYVSGVGIIAAWDIRESSPVWTRDVYHAPAIRPMDDGCIYMVFEEVPGESSFQVLDSATGALLETIDGDVRVSTAFDAHGDRLLLSSPTNGPGVFDIKSRELTWPWAGIGCTDVPTRMRWNPEGTAIAVPSFDHTVKIYDLDPPRLNQEFLEHHQAVLGLSWHPDGTKLVTACQDQTVRVFDAESGERLQLLMGHQTQVRDVRYSPDGKQIASVSAYGEVRIWNADEADAVWTVRVPAAAGTQEGANLHWCAPEKRLVLSSRFSANSVDLTSQGRATLAGTGFFPTPSADGRWLATYTRAVGVTVLPSQGAVPGEAVGGPMGAAASFEGMEDPYMQLAWVAGDTEIIAATRSGVFRIERDEGGALLPTKLQPASAQFSDVKVSTDEDLIAVATIGGHILCLASDTGGIVCKASVPDEIGSTAVSWSPTSEHLAVACADGALRILEVATGAWEMTLHGHGDRLEAVAWNPAGNRIATGSRDNTMKLWDSTRGDLVATFVCEGIVSDVCWASEGRMLVAVDRSGTVYCLDASRSLLRR